MELSSLYFFALCNLYSPFPPPLRWSCTLLSSCWPYPAWTIWRPSSTRLRMTLAFLTMEESPSLIAQSQILGMYMYVRLCTFQLEFSPAFASTSTIFCFFDVWILCLVHKCCTSHKRLVFMCALWQDNHLSLPLLPSSLSFCLPPSLSLLDFGQWWPSVVF